MNNEVFQSVFDIISPVLPEGWKKMILYAEYTAGSYSMKFYTSDSKDAYTDCFEQKGANKARLIKIFMDIDKVLSAERKTLDDKNKWSVMTMIVNADGEMKTEFDYIDIGENTIAYEQDWKVKYIK